MKDKLAKLVGFRRWINLYPPLLGAGIRVTHASSDLRTIDVELRLTRLNRNYVGTHFGGSLFAMTDPFYMVMLVQSLGPGYVCWDKAASIRFRRPGVTSVHAHFHLSDERLAEIRAALDRDGTHDAVFEVNILDPDGEVICKVERTIYCATKAAHAARTTNRNQTKSHPDQREGQAKRLQVTK
jgi:acyl-coenzyme A thioesterase PaaI-like protein